MMQPDKRATTTWSNANKSLLNYKAYINSKQDRYKLTYIDLLYVSNFKGGNASIHEEDTVVNKTLEVYSTKLKQLCELYSNKLLQSLTDQEIDTFCGGVDQFLKLTLDQNTKIFGFKASYASALLHAYLPELAPILDRRILINLGIAKSTQKDGQIKNIEIYFPNLVAAMKTQLNNGKTLRDLDREFFTLALSKPRHS